MQEDKIFLGNTPAETRRYLQFALTKLRQDYQRLILPACGELAIGRVALAAGWPAESIIAGDVSLFTSILSYAINGWNLDDLSIIIDDTPTGSHEYAEALYRLKLAVMRHQAHHYYQQTYIRDLEERAGAHIASLAAALKRYADLRGFEYRIIDLFEQINAWADDPDAIIWLNPPGYYRGYAKLYDAGNWVVWNEPEFAEFKPNRDHNKLREAMQGAKALFLWYRYKYIEEADQPFAVFSEQKGKQRWDYTLCNRPGELIPDIKHRDYKTTRHRYRIMPGDYEIRPDSHIGFAPCDVATAYYYRDLFVHRLGDTNARENYLLVIDDLVAGAIGVEGRWISGKPTCTSIFGGYIEEHWGMTASSKRHPKLNRLLMMLIKTNDFLNQFEGPLFKPLGIVTTCLSKYPELKINRGILKLIDRKQLKDGTYKLRYRAEMTEQTYQEVLVEWLMKYGNG